MRILPAAAHCGFCRQEKNFVTHRYCLQIAHINLSDTWHRIVYRRSKHFHVIAAQDGRCHVDKFPIKPKTAFLRSPERNQGITANGNNPIKYRHISAVVQTVAAPTRFFAISRWRPYWIFRPPLGAAGADRMVAESVVVSRWSSSISVLLERHVRVMGAIWARPPKSPELRKLKNCTRPCNDII